MNDDATYQTVIDNPILYESAFDDDATQGLVTLADATSCKVSWNANQFPTLQITYPKTGVGAKLIDYGLIIMADVSNKWVHQKFRIVTIAKDIDNLTITANHVIADLIGKPTTCDIELPAASATDCANAIINNLAGEDHQYYFDSDISTVSNVNIPAGPASDMFISPDQEGDTATQSILGLYSGELEFDNRTIHHSQQAGRNTGIIIQYGKNLQTIEDNTDIQNTYNAIYPVIKYTPGQAKATQDNIDWANWNDPSNWQSIGSVTYMAGGVVDIYDSPVQGQHVIGQLTAGSHVTLGEKVTNGQLIPNPNNSASQLEVDTVNGDAWYPVQGGGWIDEAWVNFDKKGDYLVNPVTGHVTVSGSGISGKDAFSNRYQLKGKAKVTYRGKDGGIQVYYSPEIGDDHYPTNEIIKYGTVITFDWVDINTKGDTWYRIGPHRWLFGPHLSIDNKKTSVSLPVKGEGYVSDNAQKYHMNSKGQMVKNKKNNTQTKAQKTQSKYRYVKINGKRKKIRNPAYKPPKKGKAASKKPVEQHKHKVDKEMVIDGVTYVHTAGGWVTASSIHYHKDSDKPKSPTDIIKEIAKTKSKVEMYDSPDHLHALNWSIPTGTSLAIDSGYEAKGADGHTYIQVTYKGVTGWIREDFTNTDGDADTELHSPDDDTTNDDGSVQQDVKEVIVDIGTVYASNSFNIENDRIERVDLSDYFKHDDQDLSGQQTDGSFLQTAADEQQAMEIAQNYIKEHRIGEVEDNFTVGYLEQTGIIGDITAVNLYDYVEVDHEQIGVNSPAEVTGIVYNCLTHRNEQITVGKPPKSWPHLLLEQANDNADKLHQQSDDKIKNAMNLTAQVNHALQLEGHERQQAELEIGKKIGVVQETVDKHGNKIEKLEVDQDTFDQRLQDFNGEMQETESWISSGGSAVLQFLDASGNQTYKNPVRIKAVGANGEFMELNGHGLQFVDENGYLQSAVASNGTIAAQYIDAGVIRSLNAEDMVVNGSLVSHVGGFEMTVGANNSQAINAAYGDMSRGVCVATNGYTSVQSSGSFKIWGSSGGHAELHPTHLDMWGNGNAGAISITPTGIYMGDEYFLHTGSRSDSNSMASWIVDHWVGKASDWKW